MPDSIAETLHVMVIDDQRTMRAIIRQLLHESHIDHVSEAGNGEEALKMLNGAEFEMPDVIICDLHMDKMDGMDFVNHVRHSKNYNIAEVPILILTGDSDRFLHDVTRQVGGNQNPDQADHRRRAAKGDSGSHRVRRYFLRF